MDIEKIERYLNGQMEPSEEESFESQMKKWPSLEEDVRNMAYIIHSIKDVAIEKENERIDKIKLSTHSDRKRYIATIAALFLAIAMVTGTIATGLYFLLKDKEEGTKQTTQSEFKAPVKIEGNPIQLPKAQQEEKKEGKKNEETNKERKEYKTSTPKPTSEEPATKGVASNQEQVEETEIPEREDNQPAPIQKQLKPIELPENYKMNDIHIRKVGDDMICSFTMTNTKETAKVRIHSPRAIDIYGKNFSIPYCRINKTSKPEIWEKGKAYYIEIRIYCLNEKNTFKQISFSFQSEGKYVKTKSMTIKLE